MKLVIGNKNYSSWSLRPWLFMAYHQLDFEEIRLAMFEPAWEEQIQQYSPSGFVPVLDDQGLIIWDSIAICEYLSEQYLQDKGWPQDIKTRARARACAAEMHAGFSQIRTAMPMNVRAENRRIEITPAIRKEIARIDTQWNSLRAEFREQGEWLFEEFTILDCMYAPMVFRFNTYGINLTQAAEEYRQFVLAHPLMQDWIQASRLETETFERSETGLK